MIVCHVTIEELMCINVCMDNTKLFGVLVSDGSIPPFMIGHDGQAHRAPEQEQGVRWCVEVLEVWRR